LQLSVLLEKSLIYICDIFWFKHVVLLHRYVWFAMWGTAMPVWLNVHKWLFSLFHRRQWQTGSDMKKIPLTAAAVPGDQLGVRVYWCQGIGWPRDERTPDLFAGEGIRRSDTTWHVPPMDHHFVSSFVIHRYSRNISNDHELLRKSGVYYICSSTRTIGPRLLKRTNCNSSRIAVTDIQRPILWQHCSVRTIPDQLAEVIMRLRSCQQFGSWGTQITLSLHFIFRFFRFFNTTLFLSRVLKISVTTKKTLETITNSWESRFYHC